LSTLTREPPDRAELPPRRPVRPAPPPRTTRSPWRLPALLALLVALGTIVYLATRSDSYRYRFNFVDAGQLVTGDLVRIGGTQAGSIDSIEITPNGYAQVGVSLDRSFGPLRQGTTATIRSPGIASVASRYIDVSPAPTFKPALPDNAVIPATNTTGIVDIDQVFDALDANTREGLRRIIRGFAAWYQGQSAKASTTSVYLPPALHSYAQLFAQINASTPALNEFINQTSYALGQIDARAPQLTDMISQAKITAQALSSDNQSLTQALVNLPPALDQGSATFARLRSTTLPALSRLFNATAPVTTPLSHFLPKLNPVLAEAVPTFALLSQVINKPGPNNDLVDALQELPQLGSQAKHDFPRAVQALHMSTPVFEFSRPYVPDLVAWLVNWDGVFAPYDANGHYARTVPVFGAFNFNPDGQGGTLSQTPPNTPGSGTSTGFLQRCPGSATTPPADGSAPFVDHGPLSNPDCRSSQTIGGTP
jgi:phospholipid/cholesterol/gamma-HCH transport system substrate-binding protein